MDLSGTTSDKSDNRVVSHEDYIEVIWNGAQNTEKVHQSNLETKEANKTLVAGNKPLLLLLYVESHPAGADTGAFRESLRILHAIKIERLAICGQIPDEVKTLVDTAVMSFDGDVEIKYFPSRDEALSWLREYRR